MKNHTLSSRWARTKRQCNAFNSSSSSTSRSAGRRKPQRTSLSKINKINKKRAAKARISNNKRVRERKEMILTMRNQQRGRNPYHAVRGARSRR